MAVIHIPEEKAVKDFGSVLKKHHAGDSIAIDGQNGSVRLVSGPFAEGKTVAEILAYLPEDSEGVPDRDFAADVAEFRKRHPESLDASRWD
jgi:hypothetical protein